MSGDPERALTTAEGYLQLGLLEDALGELERLPPEWRLQPEALQIEVAILVRGGRWEDALRGSEELARRDPRSHHGYLHTSFCLHELGRTREARDRLLAAPVFVTEQPLYAYNLACYEAQLDNPEEVESLLRVAFRKDGSLRRLALRDPDLEPVREMVRSLVENLERGPRWEAARDVDPGECGDG